MPPPYPLLPALPDWSSPVIESLEWRTNVFRLEDGGEQRVRLRRHPRRALEFSALAQGTRAQAIAGWVRALAGSRCMLPMWPYASRLAGAAAQGSTALALDRDVSDFDFASTADATGAQHIWVALIASEIDTEVVEIQALPAGASLGLIGVTAKAWQGGTHVVPLAAARLDAATDIARHTSRVPQLTLRASSDGWPIGSANAIGPSFIDDRTDELVLMEPLHWERTVDHSFEREQRIVDSGTGVSELLDAAYAEVPQMQGDPLTLNLDIDAQPMLRSSRSMAFFIESHAKARQWRQWCNHLGGMHRSFWLASHADDFSAAAPISSTDSFIDVERSDAAQWLLAAGGATLLIRLHDGQRSIVQAFGAGNVDANTERLNLLSPIGLDASTDQIRSIEWLDRVRLSADRVEIAWQTNSIATLALGTVRASRDSFLEILSG